MTVATAVELRVTGQDESQLLTYVMHEGQIERIGRAPAKGWAIPWDPRISREQADLTWDGEQLHVTCLSEARNPILLNSRSYREVSVTPEQSFRIGATDFRVVEMSETAGKLDTVDLEFATETTNEALEQSYSAEELRQVAFGNTDRQMEILAKLPELISSSQSDEELAVLLERLLLAAIPQADGVAVVQFDEKDLPEPGQPLENLPRPAMMRVETRDGFGGRFRPSRRLIMRSLGQQDSLIHIWGGGEGGETYTISEGLGWAICAPIRGESCRGWCLYVAGKSSDLGVNDDALKGHLRFTELVAQFIGSVRQVRLLQQQKTQLSNFFSPAVIDSLTSRDALTPAERDISVLFCDVRGFSRKAEVMVDDLQGLLKSVREALGVMSSGILDHDGTIADFQGDAALGFWGWPVELAEGPLPACRAALHIYRGFRDGNSRGDSLLEGFTVGMGIVYGRAIAGQIGTAQQAKVGVFGPVVNQGSRLEGLTKQFQAPICLDEATAHWLQQHMPPDEGRLRRLARVRPQGMASALTVYQLLLPQEEDDEVSDALIAEYEEALDAVIQGRWDEALERLRDLPAEDGPKQFLLTQMEALENRPPEDWDGVFTLTRK